MSNPAVYKAGILVALVVHRFWSFDIAWERYNDWALYGLVR
jgi:hypothetical protein